MTDETSDDSIGGTIQGESIFTQERRVMEHAESVFAQLGDLGSPQRQAFDDLLGAYRKLLKRTERLVKLSDMLQQELLTLNEQKNEFLGMAAHDLRNPCASIRSLSAVMLEEEDLPGDVRREFLTDISRVSSEMVGLLNNLLDISVIESGKLSLRVVACDLNTIVRGRIRVMGAIAESKGVTLDVQADPLPPVRLDPERIGQVVDNLVSNAIKFSPAGTVIRLSVGRATNAEGEAMAVLSVADQGQGIPAEEMDKLFGTFQRLTPRPTGGEKSTGLGLAIVKKIITAHHGTIHAQSVEGKGSTFTLHLPFAASDTLSPA